MAKSNELLGSVLESTKKKLQAYAQKLAESHSLIKNLDQRANSSDIDSKQKLNISSNSKKKLATINNTYSPILNKAMNAMKLAIQQLDEALLLCKEQNDKQINTQEVPEEPKRLNEQ